MFRLPGLIVILLLANLLMFACTPCHAQVPNTAVTQATVADTICKSGWTATVRPSVRYTNAIKYRLLDDIGVARSDAPLYELDHVWPIEAGGHPSDPANLRLQLWPQARPKDVVETRVKRLICTGKQPLSAAECFRNDWHLCPTN